MHSVLLTLLACSPSPDPVSQPAPQAVEAAGALDVQALSFPVGWLAEQIGGEHVEVTVLVPAGEDPASWQPPAETIAALAQADLIVMNGAGFEAWTATASLPSQRLIDSARQVDLIELPATTHSHGGEGEHSHAGTDPHSWSDPLTFLGQAKVVHAALLAAAPQHTADFDAAYGALQTTLTGLHETMGEALAPAAGVPIAANHPAYNYVARRYGLDVTSFDFDPAAVPDEAALGAFAEWARRAGPAPILWWEAPPAAAVVAAFPEATQHLVIDPLEQPAPTGYDYIAQSQANAMIHGFTFAPGEP